MVIIMFLSEFLSWRLNLDFISCDGCVIIAAPAQSLKKTLVFQNNIMDHWRVNFKVQQDFKIPNTVNPVNGHGSEHYIPYLYDWWAGPITWLTTQKSEITISKFL